MSDFDRDEMSDDLTAYSVDAEDQLQPEDTLDDRGVEDILDEGYSPPENYRGSLAHGTTASEQAHEETIDERIRQEVPDPTSAYGAPDDEGGLNDDMLGGDDPDAIPASEDFLGDSESERSGRLVAPDEGIGPDNESASVARDVGIDGAGASAEEAAMHIVSEEIDPDF